MSVYVKQIRDKGVMQPILLVGEFSHFAFDKAADLTGARLVTVPSDAETKKVSLHELKKYINWYGAKNVAAIAVAVPNYPNGVADDI